MRILTITTSYPRHPGDWAGRFVRDLNAGCVLAGHAVTTLAPWAPGLPIEERDEEAGAVRRVRGDDDRSAELFYGAGAETNARRLGILRSARAFRDAGRAFRRALGDAMPQADVVLAHWIFPTAWWAAQMPPGAPIVGIVHGADARLLSRPVLGRLACRGISGRLAAVTCVSAGAWRRIGGRLSVPPDRVLISPMGVDVTVFRASASVARDPRLVAAAGRLVPAKGFDLLLRACAGTGARVAIAGEGPGRDPLAGLARELSVPLDLLGSLAPERLARLFQEAAVVAVPSRGGANDLSEGVPMVAVEALSCGAAVVATPAGGLADLLPPHALTPPDQDSLRAKIGEALADPDRFRDLGASARFDRAAVAQRVLAPVYRYRRRIFSNSGSSTSGRVPARLFCSAGSAIRS